MIKKIDANKYGVVRYAISSIEDIADLPREVSVGSEAILVNEDGEKKFRLGSDGWVEVVEVKEYDEDKLRDMLEDAKVGYRGIEYETLEERLDKDFDNVYSVLDNRTYVEYEGCRITAKDSLNGLQKETVVKGRTLQNVIHKDTFKDSTVYHTATTGQVILDGEYIKMIANNEYVNAWTYKTDLIKPNTIYTMIVEVKENTIISDIPNAFVIAGNYPTECFKGARYIDVGEIGVKVLKLETRESLDEVPILLRSYIIKSAPEGYITFRYMILEGDYTQTPLEELPFIEGIESVGDKSKNLFDGKTRNGYYSSGEFKVNSSNLANVNPIEIKPNTYYTGSGDSIPRMSFYDSDMNFISYNSNLTTCLSPSNAKYMNIHAMGATYFQVEEGTRATPYQPYHDGYKISGKSCGVNLAKTLTEDNYEPKGTGKVIFENNKCIAMDTTGWAGCFVAGKDVIKVKSNTAYYTGLECEEGDGYLLQTNFIIKCFDINNNVITKRNGTVSVSNNLVNFYESSYNNTYEGFLPLTSLFKFVKFSNEVHSVKLMFRPAASYGTITNTFKNILFVETDKHPTYEPYKETTYSYIIDEPLHSLPDGVCDEIDLEKGVVTRRVGKYTFTGDEPFGLASEVKGDVICVYTSVAGINVDKAKTLNNAICDNLACYPYGYHEDIQGILVSDSCFIPSFKNGTLKSNDIEGAKQWFKDNPTTIYYELANPTTEYLIKDDKFVTLPNGVKDEISHNSVLRKVGKIVLDGSQVFEVATGVEGIVRWAYSVSGAKMGGSCICSMFDYVIPTQTWREPFKDGITINSENSTILIYMDKYKEIGKHMKEVSALLDGLEVYYELKTPYTEPINLNEVILNTTRLKSYEPITHITSDNYLLPTIETQVPSDFNAVVLGLKSNNEALTSQVMSLRQTNDELETTNREQDDVIDVTLLALDEVYGMIDEGEIETMSMGSPMVNVYVKMIKRGIKTLDEVPTKYRAEVEELI